MHCYLGSFGTLYETKRHKILAGGQGYCITQCFSSQTNIVYMFPHCCTVTFHYSNDKKNKHLTWILLSFLSSYRAGCFVCGGGTADEGPSINGISNNGQKLKTLKDGEALSRCNDATQYVITQCVKVHQIIKGNDVRLTLT